MSRWSPAAAATWWLALGLPAAVLVWAIARELGDGATLLAVLSHQPGLLGNTLGYAAATAVLGVALGWALAHAQHSYAFPGQRAAHWLGLAPLAMPSFTFAMALVTLLGRNGLATRWLAGHPVEVYGPLGLIVSGTLARMPLAYLALLLAYRGVDQRLIDAATDLGADQATVLRRVLLPRLAPALIATSLLLFADAAADVANPLVIGGGFSLLASRLFQAVNGEADLAAASAYAVLLLVPAVVYGVAAGFLRGGRPEGVDARARADAPRPAGAGGWLLVAVCWAVGAVVATLLAVVVVGSVWPPTGSGPIGLAHYAAVVAGPHTRALATTLLVALLAAPLVAALTWAGVAGLAGHPRPLARAERLARGLVSLPGLVIGLAAFLLLARLRALPGAPHTTSAAVLLSVGAIVAVTVFRSLPSSFLSALLAARAVTPELRQTAESLGASPRRIRHRLALPLLAPAVTSGALTAFIGSLTGISTVILLADSQAPLLTPRILVEIDAGRLGPASAMTVVLGLLVATALVLADAVGVRPARAQVTR